MIGGGDDYFIIQSNNSAIYDHGGNDVMVFERLKFSDVEFWFQGGNLVISAINGTQRHDVMDMRLNAEMGVEYVMFQDRTLTRDELVDLANAGGYRDSRAPIFEPDADLVGASSLILPQLGGAEFYG